MRHWDELARYEQDGFTVVVDKSYEDLDPWDMLSECFDDREQLYADIDSCKYDWFMLRVRALLDGHELGSHVVGGFLYENAEDVLTDGTAADLAYEAIHEARAEARKLVGSLQRVIDAETV